MQLLTHPTEQSSIATISTQSERLTPIGIDVSCEKMKFNQSSFTLSSDVMMLRYYYITVASYRCLAQLSAILALDRRLLQL